MFAVVDQLLKICCAVFPCAKRIFILAPNFVFITLSLKGHSPDYISLRPPRNLDLCTPHSSALLS